MIEVCYGSDEAGYIMQGPWQVVKYALICTQAEAGC